MSNKLRPQVILLGLVSLLNDSASEMIFPILPVFLTVTLGATPFDVGMIEGLADAIASVLKYFAGTWSDRLTRRRPLIGSGYALAAGSRALIAAATAWPMVLAARLIDRTGKGIRSAPRDALISDVTPVEQRGKAYGFHRALDHTGAIVGPLMAMAFLQGFHLQMRTVFYIAVIPGFIAVLLLLMLREPPREPRTSTTTSSAPLPRKFWAALGAISLFSLANSSDAFLLLQANAAGVSTAMLPLLWAAHHVIKALFSTRAGALSDRMDRRTLLVIGWMSYAAIYFVFPAAHSMRSFFVLFIVYAIPFTLTEGAERAWISTLVPAEARGKSFGLYYLATGIFVLGGTLLFGAIYERVSHAAAFSTGAAIALAAALAVLGIRSAGILPAVAGRPGR
ncbi:MAG TPA: MFS transporter [Thermoanaerobaculia bacterium]|nr:MFS transporter [Thermoanaerobaculia bacterium]